MFLHVRLTKNLQNYMANLSKLYLTTTKTPGERANLITQELSPFQPPTAELTSVSKKLADLLKEGTTYERLSELVEYLIAVGAEVKKIEAKAGES